MKIKLSLNFILAILIGFSLLVGLYSRLKGLGTWQLATDEYFIVKSAENILKFGVPQWDVGGYYSRGIILQYFTAFLLSMGIKAELAARILPVVSNLFAIPALYLLAKKISGKNLAIAAVILFSLSLWEIEFSRFARMYTMFQSLFVWYCYFLFRYIVENDKKSFNWMLILSVVGVFTYEGSVFLIILNFLPILWDNKIQSFNPFNLNIYKKKSAQIIISVAIFIFAFFFLTFDFRTLYLNNVLPPDVLEYFNNIKSGGFIRKPLLLIKVVSNSTLWLVLLLAPITLNTFIVYKFVKANLPIYSKVGLLTLLVFSFFNLVGLTIVAFILFSLIHWIKINEFDNSEEKSFGLSLKVIYKNRISRLLILAFVSNFIFWVLFTISTSDWQQLFPNVKFNGSFLALKIVIKESLNYPYLYETFALFRDTIPTSTGIVWFSLGLITIITLLNKGINKKFQIRFLVFILLFLGLIQNLINLAYFETRYFFFLYPLILLVVLLCFEVVIQFFIKNKVSSQFAFFLLAIMLFFASEDFSLNHVKKIDSKEINFRTEYSFPLELHYYHRWDSKSLAEIVNKEARNNDIIITNEHTSDYYLNRLDYFFNDYRWVNFPTESASQGTKDRWTNADLIYRYENLKDMLDNSNQNIWMIINTVWALDELDEIVKEYEKFLYSRSIDERILLFKINHNKS